jgi:Ca-activated chloride channel homolog
MIEPTLPEARWLAAALFCFTMIALGAYVLRSRRVGRAIGDVAVSRLLLGIDVGRPPAYRLAGVTFAAALLALAIVAAARPTPGGGARGPVVLLLDASGSMLVADVGTTRLEAQRRIAGEILVALGDVPVGVVTFAGRAFSLTPPTRDRGAVEMYLTAIDPTIVTQTGSALGAAIRQGVGLLAASGTAAGGTLVLIGDGDETDNPASAMQAADLARQNRVRIHTVGVGTPLGAPVPAIDLITGDIEGYLLSPAGEPVVSRINRDLLRSIADRTGGVHVASDDPSAATTVQAFVVGTATSPGGPWNPPAHVWLAASALLLLTLEPLGDKLRRVR